MGPDNDLLADPNHSRLVNILSPVLASPLAKICHCVARLEGIKCAYSPMVLYTDLAGFPPDETDEMLKFRCNIDVSVVYVSPWLAGRRGPHNLPRFSEKMVAPAAREVSGLASLQESVRINRPPGKKEAKQFFGYGRSERVTSIHHSGKFFDHSQFGSYARPARSRTTGALQNEQDHL